MKKNKKIILIIVVVVVIVAICLFWGLKQRNHGDNIALSIERINNLSTCVELSTSSSVINYNDIPIDKNEALKIKPYTYLVKPTCKNNGYNFYVTLKDDVDLKAVKYMVTNHGSKDVISEGILGELNDMIASLSDKDLEKLDGVKHVYMVYNEDMLDNEKIIKDIYIYVDENYTNNKESRNLTFGIALKSYEIGG